MGEAPTHPPGPPDDRDPPRQYERRLVEVSRFVADHAPYSTMCRQVVAGYHAQLFGP